MKAEAGNEAVNTTSPGSHGKSLYLIIHKVSEKSTCKEPAVAKGVHRELKKGRRLHIRRCKYRLSCYISLPVCMSYVESCFNYRKAICSIGHQEVVWGRT